jgi:hypothetical protein
MGITRISCVRKPAVSIYLSMGPAISSRVNDRNVVIGRYGSAAFIATPTGLSPRAELSNTSWTFNSHGIGETSGLGRVFLANSGTADLHIPAMYFETQPNGRPPFQITQTNCGQWNPSAGLIMTPGTLPPGGSCFLEFTFTPNAPGLQTSAIYIPDDSPTSPEVIQLRGTGIGSKLQLSNTSWTFATHRVGGTSGNGVIYAYNAGPGIVTFRNGSSISEPGGLSDFRLIKDTCGFSLAPYTTCAYTFAFTPSVPGEHAASLHIDNDSLNGPEHIELYGFATL